MDAFGAEGEGRTDRMSIFETTTLDAAGITDRKSVV